MVDENVKARRFLEDCWTVVRARGRYDEDIARRARMAWGINSEGARCYRDKKVEVVAEAEPSKKLLVVKLDTHTTVVLTDSQGKLERWGEAYLRIAAHVRVLALSAREEPPKTGSEG